MKNIIPLLSVLLLSVRPLAAQTVDTPNGKTPVPPASSQVSPPPEIAEQVRLESERATLRRALIADLKAAEKQATEAVKGQGKEAGAAIRAESIQKQKAQAARLEEINTRLQAIRPEAAATQPEKAR